MNINPNTFAQVPCTCTGKKAMLGILDMLIAAPVHFHVTQVKGIILNNDHVYELTQKNIYDSYAEGVRVIVTVETKELADIVRRHIGSSREDVQVRKAENNVDWDVIWTAR